MPVSIGRIVHYKLNADDVKAITASGVRTNPASEGQVLPAMIVATWGKDDLSACNLQVFLDGNGSHWVTSSCGTPEGAEHQPRSWIWPPRV